jgi:hypothetical protein
MIRVACPQIRSLEVISCHPPLPPQRLVCWEFSLHDVQGFLMRQSSYEIRIADGPTDGCREDGTLISFQFWPPSADNYNATIINFRTHEAENREDSGRRPVFEPPRLILAPWIRTETSVPMDNTVLDHMGQPLGYKVRFRKHAMQQILARAREAAEEILREANVTSMEEETQCRLMLKKIKAYREYITPPGPKRWQAA